RRRHTRFSRDWSSDVCSSDLRTLDEVPVAFANAIRSMSPGEVIGPIRGPSGFQLLQLVDVRESAGAGPTVTQYNARHILVRPAEGPAGDSGARAPRGTPRARIAGRAS